MDQLENRFGAEIAAQEIHLETHGKQSRSLVLSSLAELSSVGVSSVRSIARSVATSPNIDTVQRSCLSWALRVRIISMTDTQASTNIGTISSAKRYLPIELAAVLFLSPVPLVGSFLPRRRISCLVRRSSSVLGVPILRPDILMTCQTHAHLHGQGRDPAMPYCGYGVCHASCPE